MTTTRPELRGSYGMISTTHYLATAVGMAMMERGGNAFDAAVAAGFTLNVVEPNQNGPGGDMPAIFHSARTGRIETLCGQAPAPKGATIAHYRSLGLDLVPGTGLLAAVIPGAVGAWLALLRDHGTMRLADVLEPAIHYARRGFPVIPALAGTLAGVADLFREHWKTSAAIYLPGGAAPKAGGTLANPALADTFQKLIEAGRGAGGREAEIEAARKAWYEGFVAEAIDRFCRTEEVLDSSGRRHKGVLTGADMAGWQPRYEGTTALDYKGWRVHKTLPWGQGPAALQTLALLDGFDLDRLDPVGPDFVHLFVEANKLALADREAWYGDPDVVDVPMAALLDRDYTARRRALIGERASLDLRPGTLPGRAVKMPGNVGRQIPVAPGVGEPNAERGGGGLARAAAAGLMRADTVNVQVADRHGNLVSCVPSGGWLQSSPVVPGLGFCLGTRAQMFWLDEGLPASLAPGKRPRSTLTPGLAVKDGKPALAWGSPGGDGQDQWTLMMFLRHVHGRMNLQQSIDAPNLLSLHVPNSFYPRDAKPGALQLESRFPEATKAELKRRGHVVEETGPWSLSRLCAVGREADGTLKAGGNPRFEQGYAAGR
jgi:gamma-glutamyltranspeptidase/glutathione hydrolase